MPRAEMLGVYHQWENDPAVILGYGTQLPQSFETRSAGYDGQARDPRQARFEIIRLSDREPVGMTALIIDHHVRTAEYVMLIAAEARGHGHAAEATHLTLDWAFHLAALRMVWLKVLEPNTAGINAYRRAGFRPAGRLRHAGHWLGDPCDEFLLDAVKDEFAGPSMVRAVLGD